MRLFLSSTFLDLSGERRSVLFALEKKAQSTLAMEYFGAATKPPLDVALENLRKADLMILVIGNKAGSLLPDGSGDTYTSAEYKELLILGKEALVFLKVPQIDVAGHPSAWQNDENDPSKKQALDNFKALVGERCTWDYFSNGDNLALGVIQAIDKWEANGRRGARQTFASTLEYFATKNSPDFFDLLKFDIPLFGRVEELGSLRRFTEDPSKRVCILSGRGGVGKSKLLYDWANLNSGTIFLKDEPLWHEDSAKEIPIGTSTIIVDDAHRHQSFKRVLQLVTEISNYRNIKLIVSTRPGSSPLLTQQISRSFEATKVEQLPEIKELEHQQSCALAEQVLGLEFSPYAKHLAQISGNSPLVIVAGGRLIAAQRVHPSTLTTLPEFRSTIFNRFLDEMELHGSQFAIDPPRRILHLLSAIGPVDVETPAFQQSAQRLLERSPDDILRTIDALANNGIVTKRGKPVRVLPDVLSDYILESECLNSENCSTGYADRVYEEFGAHSLESLMRNLAELDWRRGELSGSKLNLLDKVWEKLISRFRIGDEYERHRILTELASAAIYQPHQVISLIRIAIEEPIRAETNTDGSLFRDGQAYVLSGLPDLLEATAQHPDQIEESIDLLWELTSRNDVSANASRALKRLASWRRFNDVAFNFAMLLQAVRLAKRADALNGTFTPFAIITELLQREGEFTEHLEQYTIALGSFGLNYSAVGPVRKNALDYLESVLAGDGRPALIAIELLENLIPFFLNRVGRPSTEEESGWQNREREECFQILQRRIQQPSSELLRARLYDAIRSSTSIHRPEAIRRMAQDFLLQFEVDDSMALIDAICTAQHELPRVVFESDMVERNRAFGDLLASAKSSLNRLAGDEDSRACLVVATLQTCLDNRVNTGGFHDFMLAFADTPFLLAKIADQLASDPRLLEMSERFSSVIFAIHLSDPPGFRQRALTYLETHNVLCIRAAAANLRASENATEEDVRLIHAFCVYPDPEAKQGGLFAIAYMGKFVALRNSLKNAALAVRSEGNASVASKLAEAFGPYGLALTDLTRKEATSLANEFLFVEDWDYGQGEIPRFLNRFVKLFPDETFNLLHRRIEVSAQDQEGKHISFRTFRLVYESVSFDGIQSAKRLELARNCLALFVTRHNAIKECAQFYWDVAGYTETSLELIVDVASSANEQAIENLTKLIGEAVPRLAFTNPSFAGKLMGLLAVERRAKIVEAFAYQAARVISGVVRTGQYEDHIAEHRRNFARRLASFPNEPDLQDLKNALRRLHP